jgi:type I restriction enzyme M protein
MITGELKSQVDAIWNNFWSNGMANPLEVMEQLTYLLFLKRLDELHTLREKKAVRLGKPIEEPIFPPGDEKLQKARWSKFKHFAPADMYAAVARVAFPFIKSLGADGSTYSRHMKDAQFKLPPEKPDLLARVVDLIDKIPMEDRDTKGDVYEYMLGKIAAAASSCRVSRPCSWSPPASARAASALIWTGPGSHVTLRSTSRQA